MVQKFIWHDLMTTDPKAAEAFYKNIIGWNMADSGQPGGGYTVLMANEAPVGGIMAIPEGETLPPCWTGYISVDDVDIWTSKVTDKGGRIWKAPQDIQGVGRFSLVADPHGAVFILFKGVSAMPARDLPMDTPGAFGWNELMSGNVDEAMDWYASLFGWTADVAHDMGGFTYHTLKTGGPIASVGMMTKMPEMPLPFWTYYTWINGIEKAAESVKSNGGKVLMGPHQVPGGAWIVSCRDPQGAHFNLIGTKE
jgi:hypothetical protein